METAMVIGKNAEQGNRMNVINPYDQKVVGTVFAASAEQVGKAVTSSHSAFKSFRWTTPEDRGEMLIQLSLWVSKNRSRLAELMARESGKPVKQCDSEINGAAKRLNVAASEMFFLKGETVETKGVTATVFREPLGVIAAISPFNYPFFTLVAKLAPAIAAGNTVVAKPPSDDPLAFMEFAWAAQEVLPAGVLNAVTGRGSVVGGAFVKNDLVKMIAFTGSYKAGNWIANNVGMKRLQLELGGKAPAIVLPDADLKLAAKEIVKGSLGLSGQRCNAISIVAAHDDVKEELTELIVKGVKKYKVGDPLDKKVDLGPLINAGAVDNVKSLVDDALSKGAVALTDYKVEGNLFYPLVIDGVNEHMEIASEETFGPIIPIMQFKDIDWLIAHFNSLPYRLDSSVFGQDYKQLFYIAKRLDEGSVHINGAPFHSLGVFPYGEAPGAGMGREGLLKTMEEMTTLKTVVWRT
jgi:acyl-CoA reductase-like NAD-dependent aldehyde dehydrogenase